MNAQERKDFRRIGDGRNVWKERAVIRGEENRRLKERRKEVERSREAWRGRALAAEGKIERLEEENQRLKSAVVQTRKANQIDNQNFFELLFSPHCFYL